MRLKSATPWLDSCDNLRCGQLCSDVVESYTSIKLDRNYTRIAPRYFAANPTQRLDSKLQSPRAILGKKTSAPWEPQPKAEKISFGYRGVPVLASQ
jgi:hypothetical protein